MAKRIPMYSGRVSAMRTSRRLERRREYNESMKVAQMMALTSDDVITSDGSLYSLLMVLC